MRALTVLVVLVVLLSAAAGSAAREAFPTPLRKPPLEAAIDGIGVVPPPIVASGLSVPRWVTVKAKRVNVRRGPSLDQTVLWTYVKPGVPVEIIAEYGAWRRIRDADGSKGWVMASLLGGRRSVVVTGNVNTAILERPKADAPAVAYAQPGLVANLISCAGEWCEISTRGYDGYVVRDRLWGVYEGETVN